MSTEHRLSNEVNQRDKGGYKANDERCGPIVLEKREWSGYRTPQVKKHQEFDWW